MIWPEIRKKFPLAELDIYYGRETYGIMSDKDMAWTVSKIEEYKDLGVRECGRVGHEELAAAMQEISVLLYPCTCYAETFCITVVKCQLAGMIPVVCRTGALEETVHPDAPSLPPFKRQDDIIKYLDLAIKTLSKIEDLDNDRDKYIEFAKKFTWQACTDKWLELHKSVKDN
jgi:glycosyltransferase involved in cell wall biosynthesis